MKKINRLEREERQKIESEIDAYAITIEVDEYSGAINSEIGIDLGLCSNCRELFHTESEYGTIRAKCEKWETMLNTSNRIKNCTRFRERGKMSLYDMKQIAVLIDIDKKEIGLLAE